MKKRKRTNLERSKLNPRDTLLGHFKQNWDLLSWKTLSKTIVQLLLHEKKTSEFEKRHWTDENNDNFNN